METERPKVFQMWGTFDTPWDYTQKSVIYQSDVFGIILPYKNFVYSMFL
jgi:hypothetical protein